jgi:hypothetical protein
LANIYAEIFAGVWSISPAATLDEPIHTVSDADYDETGNPGTKNDLTRVGHG